MKGARACVCFGDDYISYIDSKIPAEVKRCCPKTKWVTLSETKVGEETMTTIQCRPDEDDEAENRDGFSSGEIKKTSGYMFKVNTTFNMIQSSSHYIPLSPKANIPFDSEDYCLGYHEDINNFENIHHRKKSKKKMMFFKDSSCLK